MDWLLNCLFGPPEYCVVDLGEGFIVVVRIADLSPALQADIAVPGPLRFGKAERIAIRRRQAWRDHPRPLL